MIICSIQHSARLGSVSVGEHDKTLFEWQPHKVKSLHWRRTHKKKRSWLCLRFCSLKINHFINAHRNSALCSNRRSKDKMTSWLWISICHYLFPPSVFCWTLLKMKPIEGGSELQRKFFPGSRLILIRNCIIKSEISCQHSQSQSLKGWIPLLPSISLHLVNH